jgi:hypothetical protein
MNPRLTAEENWQSLRLSRAGFDLEALQSIITGGTACAVIEDFCSPVACAALVEKIRTRGLRNTFGEPTVEARIAGLSAIEYKDKTESEYLDGTALGTDERRRFLNGATDPTDDVLAMLGAVWPGGAKRASVGARDYFAGAIRVLKRAYPHNDWAPRDLPGWAIAGITAQLSWHIYLSVPRKGGEFEVWQRAWEPEDEKLYRVLGAERQYQAGFLAPFPRISESPAIGKFVLFETRHYHAFEDVAGEDHCLVISSFLAVTRDRGPLIFW